MVVGAAEVSGQTTSTGSGQAYPNKSIRIITGGVGGGNDFVARLVAQGISGPLGQPLIVENRTPALYGELVAKGSPDLGTSLHLAAELLKSMAGINIVHVP